MDAVRRPLCAGALVGVVLLCGAGVASAERTPVRARPSEVVVERGDRGPAVRGIQRALGVPADGVFGPQTERAVRRFQRRKGLVADGVVGPQTRKALGLDAVQPRVGAKRRRRAAVPAAACCERIAECESGGEPARVSPGGRYRGKYQFSRSTWAGARRRGRPGRCLRGPQDRMALKLYRAAAPRPGRAAPSCSSRLGRLRACARAR